MKGLPPDLLIVLFLLALAIVQIVRNWRRARPQPVRQPARVEVEPEDAQEPVWLSAQTGQAVYSMPRESASHFGRSEPFAASAPRPSGRYSRQSLMSTRRDLRKAIVIAAVLGPCRAAEPHDIR